MTAKDSRGDQAQRVIELINEMQEPDRTMALRIHELVIEHAPTLVPKAFYGMPGYALEGRNALFFQSGLKFKTRYCTLGFSQAAKLDDGQMWPTSFALLELSPVTEGQIKKLILQAAGLVT